MAASTAAVPDSITADRVGTVSFVLPPRPATTSRGADATAKPQAPPSDVIILFTDAPRRADTQAAVARLAALGAAVAVVDSNAYLTTLARDGGECVWISSDIEGLNRALQRRLGFPEFRLPILASIGSGGVLVDALLVEAPSYSFAGGVSIGFTPALAKPIDFCGVGKPGGPHDWVPATDVKLPWQIEPAPIPGDASGDEEAMSDWIDDVDKAVKVPASPGVEPADRLARLVQPMLASAIARDPRSLEDLPLIEMPADKPPPYIAIVFSGDGGWRDLDRTLGQVLSAHGVPVVGLDSLLYFWQPKRPEIVADDLDRIMDHYRRTWKIDHFVLIGYSFGADILPFAYNRLSPENKARITEISLLALSRNTRFEISVSEYFTDEAGEATRPVGPEVDRIPASLVQCFYGEEEAEDSLCADPQSKGQEIIRTPGGHHFGDDYEALAQRIMDGAAHRLAPSVSPASIKPQPAGRAR